MENARRTWERAQKFFGSRIWAAGLDEVRRSRALLYRAARILYATVLGYRQKRLNFRAAALTYFSVLSVVPFLAFAFAALKGFGLYKRLVDETFRPYLVSTFGENPSLLRGFEQVLGYVDQTDFSKMTAVGVLFLAYTSINLLSTIETALNDVWDAKTSRPLVRQITDYTTMMVVTPLLMLAAITLGTAASSSSVVTFVREAQVLGPVYAVLIRVGSVLLTCVALTAVYIIMPNVRTRTSSAVLGGVIGGLLWQGALLLHVKLQIGVANYNAVYSSLGAVPIFLVWLYVSWMLVLLGAQLAASHQNEQGLWQAMQARQTDQEVREIVAVACAAEVTRRFIDGNEPPTQAELTELLDAPAPTVQEVLNAMVKAGILARVVCGQELGHLPARDVDAVRLYDVREAVRSAPEASEIKTTIESRLRESLRELIRLAEACYKQGPGNLTLRQLAHHAASQARAKHVVTHPEQIDAKQPTVPA